MKTRDGFVSNSSSSSFVVVLKEDADGVAFKMFDVLTSMLSHTRDHLEKELVSSRRNTLTIELKGLEKDLEYEEKHLVVLEKHAGNKKLITAMEELNKDLNLLARKDDKNFTIYDMIRNNRRMNEEEKSEYYHPKDIFSHALDAVKYSIEHLKEKIAEYDEKLSKLKDLDGGLTLVSFEIDNDEYGLKQMVSTLSDEDMITVIERVNF